MITAARVVTPGGVLPNAVLGTADGVIDSIGRSDRTASGWLVPGFVDLHMHGGGGHDVTESIDAMRGAVAFHRAHGTTRTLVSLMAAPIDVLCEQLDWVRTLTAEGVVAGAHLEGPFLSAVRCGAQNHDHLLLPDPLVLAKLIDAAQGCLRTMTIAPELPGAQALVADMATVGVVPAIGHTDAAYADAAAAFSAGAGLATHLFNAMGPISSRSPGAGVAALDAGVPVELIADGVHVHDALARLVVRSGADIALITDAMSAAGLGDGAYTLGDQHVEVRDGTARLAGRTTIAGSTLTTDRAFRHAVQALGMSVPDAVLASSGIPAHVAGLQPGAIAVGEPADLVLLDDDLHLVQVWQAGRALL